MLYQSKVIYVAVVSILLFWVLAFISNPRDLYYLASACLLTVSIGVIVSFWPAARLALKHKVGELDKGDVLTVGIILLFSSMVLREIHAWVFVEHMGLAVRSPEMLYLPVAFIKYITTIAGFMYTAASQDIVAERTNFLQKLPGWPRAIIALMAGLAIGSGLILYSNNLQLPLG